MGSYGKNFDFKIPPVGQDRSGRYYNNEGSALPIGVPVVVAAGASPSSDKDLLPVTLAAEDANAPDAGMGGILVYEAAPNSVAFAGSDPVLTTYSDIDSAPDGAAVQVIRSGSKAKVWFRNTDAYTFMGNRSYSGRTMVDEAAGSGTVDLQVGDWLCPGAGDDTDGYWKKTTTEADKWLVVTKVDVDRGEVEAEIAY